MIWHRSFRSDPLARGLADRHYSRQKPGSSGFVPPGRCLVLYTHTGRGEAYWVTSYPFARYVKHQWAGSLVCSAFRNEGAGVCSEMIRQAVACSINEWPEAPGMVTFVDETKVKPTKVRGNAVWGWTFVKAGFQEVGRTKGGLLAFYISRDDMPAAAAALPGLTSNDIRLEGEGEDIEYL